MLIDGGCEDGGYEVVSDEQAYGEVGDVGEEEEVWDEKHCVEPAFLHGGHDEFDQVELSLCALSWWRAHLEHGSF